MSLVIRVSDCRYRVFQPQELEILRVGEFTVSAGEQCALFGPSGSGKTTLFNILAGLLAPTSGAVEIAGTSLESLAEHQRDRFRGRNIGFVFQSFNLLPGLSVRENVLIGMTLSGVGVDRERAEWLLEEVGLKNRLNHRPFQLSIGEQQRVAVARSLAHKPSLLLADEPTGSLDPRRAADVMDLLVRLSSRENCTLLVISHDAEIVRRFSRQVSMLELNRALSLPPEKGVPA
jgi:putative ABC transport system ATP-binding protein